MHRAWGNGFHHMNRFGGEAFNGMTDFWTNNSGWLMVYDIAKFLIFIFAIIFVIRLLVKNFGRQEETSKVSSSNRATQLLKERYAAGEIDESEYHHRLEILNEE